MVEFEEKLRKSGLTGNEASVYLELLRKGPLTANELSKKVSMDRTLIYTVLNHLVEKGMVNYVIKENKKIFRAANPDNLLNPIKEKEVFVRDVVSQLQEIERIEESDREVNVYEGNQGLRTVLRELLKYSEASAFGSTGRAYEILYDLPHIAKKVSSRKSNMRIITTSKHKTHPMTQIKWIKYRYLDLESKATTVIVRDKVAIFFSIHKPIIIVIKNKEIAESYQNHFEVLWKIAKEI